MNYDTLTKEQLISIHKDTLEYVGEISKEYDGFLEEIERLNNIINELEKCIKNKYYEAIDYQTKIRQSDLMQGDYPVSYYLEEQNEQLCNYFLNRLKRTKRRR